jgi:hypothetical protein
MKFSAKQQEDAFAEKVRTSPEFVDWFLSLTPFAGKTVEPILIRSDNPWYQSKKTGRQSETDILLVFAEKSTGERFAIHIENKTIGDHFRPEQAELYHERADDWRNTEKWGNYEQFVCVLTAPQKFLDKHADQVAKFHAHVSHETLSNFLPQFSCLSVTSPPFKG